MISRPGSGKWVVAVIFAVLAVVIWSFPEQIFFLVKFIWELTVLNLKAWKTSLLEAIQQYRSLHH